MNEIIVKGSKNFIDSRGKISNYELSEPINWIGLIDSKKGSLRGNHYHPKQQQKVLLISGKYISVSKKLPDGMIETVVVNPGDLVITDPNIAHTMIFLEDSLIINLVKGDRESKNYNKHTVKYDLIDDELKEKILRNYKYECFNCDNESLIPIISFGLMPLANNLLNSIDDKEDLYPLQLNYCPKCCFCQLSHFVPREKLFNKYLYFSSVAKSFVKHFEDLAEKLIKEYNPKVIIDIGSNDGIFLKPLKDRGIEAIGVEPAKNLAKIANKQGLKTINAYFEDVDLNLLPKADIVTAFNVFAHTAHTKTIVDKVFKILKKDGLFIIEVQYLLDMINKLLFDNIYHEHLFYYSVTSLNNFFDMLGKKIVKVEHIDTHGGSIRVYVKRKEDAKHIDSSVNHFLKKEKGLVDNINFYLEFAKKVEGQKEKIVKKFNSLKGFTIGYGAPAKATTLLNYYGIKLKYTIDDNPSKQGKYIPGVKTKIISKESLKKIPNNVIVLAWNFYKEIKDKNKDWVKKGVKFITLK